MNLKSQKLLIRAILLTRVALKKMMDLGESSSHNNDLTQKIVYLVQLL